MEEATSAKRYRILLMSRVPAGEERAWRLVSRAGWQIVNVGDAVEALAAVRAGEVDLVLLHLPVDETADLDLPNVLRRVAPVDFLPVIILADDVQQQRRCEFLDCGADDVICDQTSQAEAIARIRSMLRIKHLNDQLAASGEALRQALDRERKLLSKLRADNAELQALCTTDPLTHLQNVRSFHELLLHEFRGARRYGHAISLLMLDVDHFKLVNDAHGHPTGDYVLKELAVILTQSVRDSDVVARTGGEEFSIILPKADARQAALFAERIRQEVAQRVFSAYGNDLRVSISIGSAAWPQDAEICEAEMLAYFADQALLHAKGSGPRPRGGRGRPGHSDAPPLTQTIPRQPARGRGCRDRSTPRLTPLSSGPRNDRRVRPLPSGLKGRRRLAGGAASPPEADRAKPAAA